MNKSVLINVREAKTHFSRLINRVIRGQVVIIARRGQPVAQFRPLDPRPGPRKPGSAKGRIWISIDFDAPIRELERAISR